MPNRLSNESSLYLRQHSNQIVEWQPWSQSAIAEAKTKNKPLLISIGYSACHWCHVMAHECFDDPYIAELMNKHFICVKVDREERPDVDQVYMEAVQMLEQRAGWPLNVFCLPDGRPFFGGTYFPPKDLGNGLIPWPQLLMRITEHFRRSKEELVENADAIHKNILAANDVVGSPWSKYDITDAVKGICGTHDDDYGGFGKAPKFPPAMVLNFLRATLELSQVRLENPKLGDRVNSVCHQTLKAMAHGGLYDQFGGGFARYSVDSYWLIPHFEKMLYDNALLIDAYTRGWLDSKNPLYEAIIDETIEWLDREMISTHGGYFSALDADSDGNEGRYYVWCPEEMDTILGLSLSREVRNAYNVTAEGNFKDGYSNPSLIEPDFDQRLKLAPARKKLREHRELERKAPGRDPKLLTAWNSLLARSMAEAGFYLNRPNWLTSARRVADFIWEKLATESNNGRIHLKSVYYEDSGPSVEGYLHDYALAAEAFLAITAKIDWLDAGASQVYLHRAKACLNSALDLFEDVQSLGYYFTAEGAEAPLVRRKEWFDNATPSGNSVMLHALSALYTLTGEVRYEKAFSNLLPAYSDYSKNIASGVAHALEAITIHQQGIEVYRLSHSSQLSILRKSLANQAWKRRFVLFSNSSELKMNYQLCIGTQCHREVNNVNELFT
ncbi:MAG: thioredoxin domain-containing protein [Verrucomicrobiota bacterium]|nr:thioredoxin domain-containing protein [Verrucomicrobiota bacterium]